MGNDTSILHFTPQCSGLAGPSAVVPPFLPMVIWFWIFIGVFPTLFNLFNGHQICVTVSECLREPGSIFSGLVFVFTVIIWYICICNRTSWALIVLEVGFLVGFLLVLYFNPITSTRETAKYDEKKANSQERIHRTFAFLLFLYMYAVSLWLNSTTFQNTDLFGLSVVLNVLSGLICFAFTVAYIDPSKWGERGGRVTVLEWVYCFLFSVQILMIRSEDVGIL